MGSAIVTLVLHLVNLVEVVPVAPSSQNSSNFSTTDWYTTQNLSTTTAPTVIVENITTSFVANQYQYCGANDCQIAEIIDESLDQYVPTNQITLYVLTGCFLLMMVLGLVCHIVLLPKISFSEWNQTDDSELKESDNERKTLRKVSICFLFLD